MTFDDVEKRFEATLKDPQHQAFLVAEEARRRSEMTRSLALAKTRGIADAGIPRMFVEKVAGALEPTKALAEVGSTGDDLVVLAGVSGCGKTVAACAWLYRFLMQDSCYSTRESLPVAAPRFIQPLFVTSARLSRWDRYDGAAMASLLKADRLVLDDLGNEYSDTKGNFLAILDEVVADRAANRRPTVVTTNLDAVAFKARYGERIADRIRESGRFVSLSGGSMRRVASLPEPPVEQKAGPW